MYTTSLNSGVNGYRGFQWASAIVSAGELEHLVVCARKQPVRHAVAAALTAVNSEHATAHFRHCGYGL